MTPSPSAPTDPIRTIGRLLVGVAAVMVLEQLVIADPARPVGWDEAIYLSQVTPGMEPLLWVASRARGITLIAFPFAQMGLSLGAIRVLVGLLGAAATGGAFWIWRREIGVASVWAAVLFGTSWLVVFYGGAIMPNLWSAIVGVAALGVAASRHAERREHLLLAVLLAAAALIRPSDAAIVALGCCAFAVVWRDVREATAAVGGFAVGFLPWLVEMGSRLGSIPAAFEAAGRTTNARVDISASRILQYLAVADGPTVGPLQHPEVSPWVWLGLGALVTVALAGIWTDRHASRLVVWVVLLITAAAFVTQYVFVVGGVAPRFLLPALGILSLPAGVGVAWLTRRRIASAAALVVFASLAIWQGTVVRTILAGDRPDARWVTAVAGVIASRSHGAACALASSRDYPRVAYETRCAGSPLPDEPERRLRTLTELRASHERVFAVVPTRDTIAGCEPVANAPIRGSPFEIFDCSS